MPFNFETKAIAFVAAGVFILAVLVGVFFWGRGEGVKADAKRSAVIIEKLDGDLKACRSNVDTLTIALDRQNDAVDSLKADADERTQRAQEAIRRAEQQAAHYRAKADRIAAAKPGPDMCASARQLIIDSLAEDRQ